LFQWKNSGAEKKREEIISRTGVQPSRISDHTSSITNFTTSVIVQVFMPLSELAFALSF
jgi:hypothetical protein